MNAKQIRDLRVANGIKQKELAELLGIPLGTWSNVELGNAPLKPEVRERVIQLFNELGIHYDKSVPRPQPRTESVDEVTIPIEERKYVLYHEIAREVAQTLERKNRDYGDSFFETYEEFGDLSTYIRLKDKLGRLKTLIEGNETIKDEPLEDVYRDIAGYCILTLASKERIEGGY